MLRPRCVELVLAILGARRSGVFLNARSIGVANNPFPIGLLPPSLEEGAAAVAHQLLRGAAAAAKENASYACNFLAAWAAECALKSILAASGLDEDTLRKSPYGHDIRALWKAAEEVQPALGPLPKWAEVLAELHVSPFHLRYHSKVHGMQMPNAESAVTGLKALLVQMDQRQSSAARR